MLKKKFGKQRSKSSNKKMGKIGGGTLFVPSEVAIQPDFFRAMMDFQYGNRKKSEEGAKKMLEIAKKKK